MRKTKTETEMREMFRQHIAINYRTQTRFAEEAGISVQYVCNILAGAKPLPDWLIERYLAWEKVPPEPQPVRYRKKGR